MLDKCVTMRCGLYACQLSKGSVAFVSDYINKGDTVTHIKPSVCLIEVWPLHPKEIGVSLRIRVMYA